MKVQTKIKTGGLRPNHVQALVVKTGVKAGGFTANHAQTQASR
jgi:hypothetical protein